MKSGDILDHGVASIALDDYTRITERTMRKRLAAIRGTRTETSLLESWDRFAEDVRDAIMRPGEYGPEDEYDDGKTLIAGVLYDNETLMEADPQ